jgi:MFS family permease
MGDSANSAPIDDSLFHRTFDSLSDPAFRNFFFGFLLLMGGVNIQMVARGVLAFELTGSVLAVSYVGAGFAPPILLFSLFGGAIADRVNRKQIIQFGQVGMALISGGVAVSILTDNVTIWHLIGASIMQGTLWAFLMPARQAIIPQIVGEKRMINAVALSSSGMALMTLGAPGIGGLAYFYFGPGTVYVIISSMAIASFLLTTRLPDVGKMPSKAGVAVLEDMKEGLRYVMQRRMVMLLLAMALSTAVLAMPFRSLLVVLVQDEFGRGADAFGFLLSAFGLGALVGSLGFAGMRATGPRGMALIATTTLSGIAILAAAVSPSYILLMIIMVFVGLGDSGRRTLNSALLMEQVDDEHRGRVMGLYMMNFGLMPLGIIPIAAIAEFAGIREALSVSAVILIAVGVSFFALSKRTRDL